MILWFDPWKLVTLCGPGWHSSFQSPFKKKREIQYGTNCQHILSPYLCKCLPLFSCLINIFIYLLCWVLVASCGTFSHSAWTLVVDWGLSICSAWFSCPAACRILVLSWGIKPLSPALQGRFITTRTLAKSPNSYFHVYKVIHIIL